MGEGLSIERQVQTVRKNLLNSLLNAVLPQDCQLCATPDAGDLLCSACLADLPPLPADRCPICALPTPGAGTNATPCGECLRHPPHFDATHANFAYGFPLDQLVQKLKYGHQLALADFFARLMQTRTRINADMMIALPLSRERLRERGFNQAVEIARPLAQSSGIPLDLFGTTRSVDTVAQAGLPWKERRANMRHAFECAIDLNGKSVVVVDDVMTTGATLDEFAKTLKYHGAAHVSNWVLARTLKHEP
jgi:ComF family protein